MSRFEGYQPEREVKRQAAYTDAAKERRQVNELLEGKRKSLSLLNRALPLLIKRGRSIAMPAEVPTLNPFNRNRLTGAWVVKSYMSSAGNGDYGNQSPSLQAWALTENGLYGMVGKVDRGIPALKFWGRPSPLAIGQMSGGEIYGTNMQEWQVIEKHVSDLLGQVGIEFKAH